MSYISNMDMMCNICQDVIQPFIKRVSATHCGHIFHEHCLLEWIHRSSTCPQCRQEVTTDKLHRIYFTFGNEKSESESAPEVTKLPLEEQIHNLQFKILLKDKYINHYNSKSTDLEKQNKRLREEIWKAESQINLKNSFIFELKLLLKESELEYVALKHKLFHREQELQRYKELFERQNEPPQYTHVNAQPNLIYSGTENPYVEIGAQVVSDTPAQDCLNNLNNHIELTEEVSCTSKMRQIDRKKKSGNPELEECPVIKKKAKLF